MKYSDALCIVELHKQTAQAVHSQDIVTGVEKLLADLEHERAELARLTAWARENLDERTLHGLGID